jgi:folate/biopterin transporter
MLKDKQSEIQKNNLPIYWSKNKGIVLFNIPMITELWAIAFLYFVQGLLGISKIAINFYYKDMLNLSPFELTIITSITAIPWIIKPFYGFISDTYPFFGYKRKSYLVLSSLLGSVSWIIMANFVSLINIGQIDGGIITLIYSMSFVTLSFIGLAFSDVLLDAIAVNKIRGDNTTGSIQTIFWVSSSLGSIISSYFSGYLLQNYGTVFVFYLSAVFPLITLVISIFIKESLNYKLQYSRVDTIKLLKIKIKKILNTLSQKTILYPLLFLMILNATPKIGTTLFYYEVNKLGFQPEFFGMIGSASSIASLLGIVLYNQKLKSIHLRAILKWTCILSVVLGMLPFILVTHVNRLIGIPDTWFAILDDIVISIFSQITTIPILVLAAQICPPGMEGMLYATITSANNLSNNIGKLLGGLLTLMLGVTNDNFTNLPWLIVFANIFGLVPLIFLNFIPKNDKK